MLMLVSTRKWPCLVSVEAAADGINVRSDTSCVFKSVMNISQSVASPALVAEVLSVPVVLVGFSSVSHIEFDVSPL